MSRSTITFLPVLSSDLCLFICRHFAVLAIPTKPFWTIRCILQLFETEWRPREKFCSITSCHRVAPRFLWNSLSSSGIISSRSANQHRRHRLPLPSPEPTRLVCAAVTALFLLITTHTCSLLRRGQKCRCFRRRQADTRRRRPLPAPHPHPTPSSPGAREKTLFFRWPARSSRRRPGLAAGRPGLAVAARLGRRGRASEEAAAAGALAEYHSCSSQEHCVERSGPRRVTAVLVVRDVRAIQRARPGTGQ